MMTATIIMGSPRGTKGASSRVAHHFSAGLRRAGVEVEKIMLKDYTINHCLGCYTCWTKTPGKCVHRDDMDRLLPKMQADLIIWATPLYFFSIPGIVKDFLDRQLPLIEPFLIKQGESTGHPLRGSSKSHKFFLISVAGFPERSHFDGLVTTFKKFSRPYLGEILIGGAEPISRDELQGAYTDLYQLIEQAGFEVGKNGQMTQTTEQAIIEKTTFSPERIEEFRKISNAYWEALLPKEPAKKQDVKIVAEKELKISDGGISSFFAGMAMQYNPKVLPGFTGVIQFNFEEVQFHLLMKDEQCKAYKGKHPEPDLTIITPKQVWLDISSGKLDGTKAYMESQYKIEGDMNLLMKFDQLFGSEKTQEDTSRPKESPKDDNIPEHRGPITIPAMIWLTIAFIPWMIQWIGGSITPSPLSRYVAAAVAALISGYHLSTNIVTLFEAGTTLYFIVSAILTATGWGFFTEFGRVVDYLFLSGLWFGSVPRRFSLTAEYSRYLFPKIIWGKRSFKETNMIICTVWGGYFLVAALLNLIIISGAGSKIVWIIINYAILVQMFVFTSRFQKWYPDKLMRSA